MTLNIGLIGYGKWAPNIVKNSNSNPKINLKWICDKNDDRIKKAKSTFFSKVNYTKDYKKIINDKTLDSVAVATGTNTHYSLVKHALLMGKHVFVEKPFTSTVKEAIILKKLAKKMKLKIHVDHIMVHHAAIKKIKQLIVNKSLGNIFYFDCKRINIGQVRNDVSVTWDLAIHDLSIIDFLTNGKKPNNISAVGKKYLASKESLSFLNLFYPNFISHLQSSWISDHPERKLIIVGSEKTLIFDDLKQNEKLKVYKKNNGLILEKNVAYNSKKLKKENPLYNSIENFRKVVEKNYQSISGPDQAIRIQKILEKADKCMLKK